MGKAGRPLPRLPMALAHAGTVSPCRTNACRACCIDTRMPLLASDIDRLARVTGKSESAFSLIPADDPDGPRRLKNHDGACVFLGPTGCTVYDDRPAGCRLYPLVLDPDTGRGILDPDCPHTRDFRVRPRDRAALTELIAALGLDPGAG